MGKNFVINLGLVALIGVGVANAQGFERLIKIPYGADFYSCTPCFAMDMDHDSLMEFGMWCADEDYIFEGWQIWKCIPPDSFVLVKQAENTYPPSDPTQPGNVRTWDVGDADGDGKTELVGVNFGEDGLYVQTVESEDHYSLPSTINWSSRYSTYAYMSTPFYLADLDEDDKTDILFLAPGMNAVLVYENVQNDSNRLVWTDTLTGKDYSLRAFVWGDFDGDGRVEFLSGGLYGDFVVWEHTATDNAYKKVYTGTGGAYDAFGGKDMDLDGKPEFFFSFYAASGWELWRYHAITDNQYEDEQVALGGWGSYHGFARSAIGDVDGDSLLEVVWSLQTRILLLDDAQHNYKELGEWTSDHGSSPVASLVTCSDLDLDGKDEILVSGNFYTSIFKWNGTGIEEKPAKAPPLNVEIPSIIQQSTSVKLSIGKPGRVSVKVYNAAGRLVTKLADGFYQAGEHHLTWDASLEPAGVYFIRATTSDNQVTRKVTVLK